jgi:hypothetical protein
VTDASDERADWQQRRREAADEQLAALRRRQSAETERAKAQVADFVAAARERGLPTEPLRARALNGRTTYRTSLVGWYVKRDRSMAVGEDGAFYLLTAPAGITARLRGAHVAPSDPPLVVGVGGRDGESIPLQTLLERRLEEPPS